jgi:glycosyltransferase involved in cell wall biosynthesis
MRIFGMHDDSGCGFYRVRLPLEELARHGHETKIVVGRDVRVAEAAQWPVIVGQRIDKHDALSPWRRLRATSRLVYEIDDDVFNVEQINWQAYGVYGRAETQDAVIHAAEVADVVTVTCEPLAQVMREYSRNVVILPNFIPGWVCDLPRQPRPRPVVGWQGGASHGRDIQLIARPLRRFLDRHPGWDAEIMGTDYRPTVRHERAGFAQWVDIKTDARAYYGAINWEIGLAPLVTSTFAKSKSYVKCLEMGARGIPVIASDVDPYRDFVLHGVTGFLVKYDHEWLKYLRELAADAGLRAEMGAKAREHARGFTIEGNYTLWEQVYGGLG